MDGLKYVDAPVWRQRNGEVCLCLRLRLRLRLCLCLRLYLCVSVCVCVSLSAFASVSVCMRLHVCVWCYEIAVKMHRISSRIYSPHLL